jgi:hypothetical protein
LTCLTAEGAARSGEGRQGALERENCARFLCGLSGYRVGMNMPEKRVEPAQVPRLRFDPYTGKPYPPQRLLSRPVKRRAPATSSQSGQCGPEYA